VFRALEEAAALGDPFDILHDHCGFTAVAFADRVRIPIVHTLHGPFTTDTTEFYGSTVRTYGW
jgi:hypothetical protein